MSESYSAPIRSKLAELRMALAKASAKADGRFHEHDDLVREAANRLADHEKMFATICRACDEPIGAHGRAALCLCGCPWEAHTKIREFTPKIQRATFHRPDGSEYGMTLGETPFERRFCFRCRSARFREHPIKGEVCASWETAPGAESCPEVNSTHAAGDTRPWFSEHKYRTPFPEEVTRWREKQSAREAKAEKLTRAEDQSRMGDVMRAATPAEISQLKPRVQKRATGRSRRA